MIKCLYCFYLDTNPIFLVFITILKDVSRIVKQILNHRVSVRIF